MISSSKIKLTDNHELNLINFDGYDDTYKSKLDDYLVFICQVLMIKKK